MADQQRPKAAAFDINRPRGADAAKAVMFPTVPGGLPAIPPSMDGVDAYLAAMRASLGDVAKATQSSLMEAAKALGADVPQAFSYSSMSFMPDPGNYGLMQWPGLNPESLAKISRENLVPQVIVQQRVSDIARYAGLSTHSWKPGWRITLRDASETPTRQDKEDIKAAQRFLWNCNMEGMDPLERDGNLLHPFSWFLRSFAREALVYDGWSIWTDRDSQNRVRAFTNLPAGMIRLAVPTKGVGGNRNLFAALVDETGSPVKPFTRKEMTWNIRNVRLDPSVGNYGYPEIEMAVRLIQAFQSGVDLNADAFVRNSIPNGMLLLKGDYWNQEQIDALMREWTNMKRGISKLWGMPVMAIPEESEVELMQFMDLKGTDVRFKDHMNMMMGVACLVWCFPIRRLGMFVSGHARDNQPVQDAAIEIQGADDPGLPPLLMHAEDVINPYLLWPRWPNLLFEFLNKNPKESAREHESRKLARTWGEARTEIDLPKLTQLAKTEYKPLAEIMDLAPTDPNLAGIFQTVAVKMLEAKLGGGSDGSTSSPGNNMTSKKDPAESQGHGHLAGVRRDSRAEKDHAEAGKLVE